MQLTQSQRAVLNRLDELWASADDLLSGYPIPEHDLRFTILFQLSAATHRLIRGVIAQVRGGSVDGLESLIRPILEALMNVEYILKDDTQLRARAFLVDDYRSRLANTRKIITLLEGDQASAISDVTDIETLRQSEAKLATQLEKARKMYGKSAITWPPLDQRAIAGGTFGTYVTAYWLTSHDEHLTLRGLNRFVRRKGRKVYFDTGVTTDRLDTLLRTAYLTYLAFLNTCTEHLGHPLEGSFEQFQEFAEKIQRHEDLTG